MIFATLVVVGVEIVVSLITYGWDMRTALQEPDEWESDEWLAAFAALWIVPMGVLVGRTFRLYQRSSPRIEAMRTELARRQALEAEHATRIERQRADIQEVIATHAITPHFQPIVVFQESVRIVGYEALARFPTGSPQSWFTSANDVGLTRQLELEAIGQALSLVDRLPTDCHVSLNASPVTIDAPEFFALFRDVQTERVVVEITENLMIDDYQRTNRILAALRRLGVRTAVDDAGAGSANLQHLVNLELDLIKIDRSLVERIHIYPSKRAMARAIASFASEVGVDVVAEGIEEAQEMATLRELGIFHGQGYLFARPAPIDAILASVSEESLVARLRGPRPSKGPGVEPEA